MFGRRFFGIMPRRSRKQMLMERQNPAAPWLFDEHQLPVRPDVLQAVKDERYRHTGARLLDDEAKALRLVELLSAKWGVKRISREMGISKWTVIAARDVLVKRGQLAPYKERLVQIYEEIVETGALKYLVALENGKITPAQIPFGVGIFSDKRALALGEPTVIGAGASGPSQDDLSVDRLN